MDALVLYLPQQICDKSPTMELPPFRLGYLDNMHTYNYENETLACVCGRGQLREHLRLRTQGPKIRHKSQLHDLLDDWSIYFSRQGCKPPEHYGRFEV